MCPSGNRQIAELPKLKSNRRDKSRKTTETKLKIDTKQKIIEKCFFLVILQFLHV